MQIETHTSSGYKILRIREKLIADSDIEDVAKCVESELKKGRKKIALSFLPPTYPFSPVLSCLTTCYRIAQQHNANLSIIASKQEFVDVILETHLDKIFDIYRSEEELERSKNTDDTD